MKQDKNTFFLLVLGLGLTALALFFAFWPNSASFFRVSLGEKSITGGINSSLPASELRNEDTGALPSINSSFPLSESHDPLEPIADFLKKQGVPAPPLVIGGNKPAPDTQSQKPSASPPKPLTEQEIFDRIWPKEYRETIRQLEELVIENGVLVNDPGFGGLVSSNNSASGASGPSWHIPKEERGNYSSDEEFFKSLLNIAKEAREQGLISEKEYGSAEKWLKNGLPEEIKGARAVLSAGQTFYRVLPGAQKFASAKGIKETIRDVMDGLFYALLQANPAEAAWVRSPDCYKDDDPYYQVEGFNGWAYCCNCGYYCTPTGCVFVEDCGEKSTLCNRPEGCLNKICAEWPNAIWDRLDYPWGGTGICGCG